MKEVYLKVTNDQYSLPVAVADSVEELCKLTGAKLTSLIPIFSKIRRGRIKSRIYEIVYLED